MSTITETVDVNVPVSTAYNQWTQFESLSVVGTPVNPGILVCWLFVSFPRSVHPAVDPLEESRWSARSEARTNDLDADEDSPHVGTPGWGETGWVSGHVSPCRLEVAVSEAARVPAPSLIWVRGPGRVR